MSREAEAAEFLRAVLPEPVAAAFALVTQLGDVWFYVVVLTLLYWYGDRDCAARILGVALGAISLTLALKHVFAVPRPEVTPLALPAFVPGVFDPFYREAVSADGYGFPSGHAVGSAAIWGAIAFWSEIGTRRQRLVGWAALVALISLSRLVLGVHALADVVAGVAGGGAYLAVVGTAAARADDPPTVAFVAATVVAAFAVVATGGNDEGLAAFGATVGALVAWHAADVPKKPWPWSAVGAQYALACVVGLELLVAVWYVVPMPPGTVAALAALGVGSVVAAPALVRRVKERKTGARTS